MKLRAVDQVTPVAMKHWSQEQAAVVSKSIIKKATTLNTAGIQQHLWYSPSFDQRESVS